MNQQSQLSARSTLRTTFQTKSSKNVHTDLTVEEDDLAGVVTVEVEVMVGAEAAEAMAEAAATAVVTVEAVEEDMVAAEAADATSTKHK